jgi:probable addiction module antidote protein
MSQLSRETGISREGLNKALSGSGNPTLATILKVSKALNLKLSFQPAG